MSQFALEIPSHDRINTNYSGIRIEIVKIVTKSYHKIRLRQATKARTIRVEGLSLPQLDPICTLGVHTVASVPHTYACVRVYVCVFIKLHITAQSGPVIRVILCHSYVCMYGHHI